MNSLQLAWLDHWDEETLNRAVVAYVRREGRLPDYGQLVSVLRGLDATVGAGRR